MPPKTLMEGGGWIGANDQGLLVCLLNAYDLGTPVTPPERSRGLVVMDLLDTSETDEALERLKTLVKDYEIAPCRILCWSRIPPRVFEVFEREIREKETTLPMLTTSSYRPEEVGRWRTQAYGYRSSLEDFHGLKDPEHPANGVWMEREDACTVSQTRVTRTSDTVRMSYRTSPDDSWTEVAIPLAAL